VDIALLVLVGLVVLVGIWLWSTYNALVALNVRVDEAWSDITVQLKRRADLIPNLIETVKGYAAYEGKVFDDVTKARAATVSPEALAHPEQAAAAENMLQGALKSLFAVAEAYPQLQASQNFLQLQAELMRWPMLQASQSHQKLASKPKRKAICIQQSLPISATQ